MINNCLMLKHLRRISKQSNLSKMKRVASYLPEKDFLINLLQSKSTFSTNKNIQLSAKEQKAIVAFFILRYLQDFSKWNYGQSPLSIRERITSREIFTKYILDQVNQITLGKATYSDIRQLGIEQQNYKEVLNGFTIGEGMLYDPQVFTQDRMRESVPQITIIKGKISQNTKNIIQYQANTKTVQNLDSNLQQNKIVLNPTIPSVKIINLTFSISNKMISGDKGSGKSFAYLLYSYISRFIIRCLIDKENCPGLQSQLYKQVLSTSSFYNVKKMFYVAMKQPKQFTEYTNIFERQSQGLIEITFPKLLQKNLSPEQHMNELAKKLLKIQHVFSVKGVQSFCVVEQANSYYSDARKYFDEERLDQSKKTQNLSNNFKMKSYLLTAIKMGFSQLILSCSQNIEAFFLQDKLEQKNFFNFYAHQKSLGRGFQIKYTIFLKTLLGNIELYGVYWFQLSKYLYYYGIEEQKMKKLRPLFNNLFGLQDLKNVEKWINDVKPLNIRRIMEEEQNLYFLADHIMNNQKFLIIDELKYLKTKAEDYKKYQLQKILKRFIKKHKSDIQKEARFLLIYFLHEEAKRQAQQDQSNQKQQNFFIIDFDKIKETKNSRFYFFNKSSQSGGDQSLINTLCQDLRIGFYNNSTKKYIANYSPGRLSESTQFILEEIILKAQFRGDAFYQIITQFNMAYDGDAGGSLLDKFGNIIMKRGFFKLKLDLQQTKQLNIRQIFDINAGSKFNSINRQTRNDINTNLKTIFDRVINCQNGLFEASAPYNPKSNQGFDCILVKKNQQSDNILDIITIDWKLSTINSKLNKQYRNVTSRYTGLSKLCPKLSSWEIDQANKKSLLKQIAQLQSQKFQNIEQMCEKLSRKENFSKIFASQNTSSESILKKICQESAFESQNEFLACIKQALGLKMRQRFDSSIVSLQQKAFLKHHFINNYQNLRSSTQKFGINWKHIIAVPKDRFDNFLNGFKNNARSDNQERMVYPEIEWIQDGNKMKLSYNYAPLTFNADTFEIKPLDQGQNIYSDQNEDKKQILEKFLQRYTKFYDLRSKNKS